MNPTDRQQFVNHALGCGLILLLLIDVLIWNRMRVAERLIVRLRVELRLYMTGTYKPANETDAAQKLPPDGQNKR